jgi:cytochrome P450
VPAHLVRNYDLLNYSMLEPDGDVYDFLSSLSKGPRAFYNTTPCVPVLSYSSGMWVLTRAQDIRTALQNPHIFSSSTKPLSNIIGESWNLIPIELDPPKHSKFRAVLNPVFSPMKLKQMEEELRACAVNYIEGFAGKGECDFVAAFGQRFPIHFFMQLLGLPEDDAAQFLQWEDDILHTKNVDAGIQAVRDLAAYLRKLIAQRKAAPTDDIISYCLKARIDGEPLADDDILGICALQFIAGLDTVTAALGLQFRYLAENPDFQNKLRANPALIPNAVEELLRRFALITVPKVVAQDVEWAGVPMKAGEFVVFSTPLANLDPDEFDRPMDVDIDRVNNPHTAFFYGPHRCLGSHLARRELVIAIEEWLKRVPEFRIKPGASAPILPGSPISVPHLPLTW